MIKEPENEGISTSADNCDAGMLQQSEMPREGALANEYSRTRRFTIPYDSGSEHEEERGKEPGANYFGWAENSASAPAEKSMHTTLIGPLRNGFDANLLEGVTDSLPILPVFPPDTSARRGSSMPSSIIAPAPQMPATRSSLILPRPPQPESLPEKVITPARIESRWKKFWRKAAAPLVIAAGLAGSFGINSSSSDKSHSEDGTKDHSHQVADNVKAGKAVEIKKAAAQKVREESRKNVEREAKTEIKKEGGGESFADPDNDFANAKAEDISGLSGKFYELPLSVKKWANQFSDLHKVVNGTIDTTGAHGAGEQFFGTLLRHAKTADQRSRILELQKRFNRASGYAAMYDFGGKSPAELAKISREQRSSIAGQIGNNGRVVSEIDSLTATGVLPHGDGRRLRSHLGGVPVGEAKAGEIALYKNWVNNSLWENPHFIPYGASVNFHNSAVLNLAMRILCPDGFSANGVTGSGVDSQHGNFDDGHYPVQQERQMFGSTGGELPILGEAAPQIISNASAVRGKIQTALIQNPELDAIDAGWDEIKTEDVQISSVELSGAEAKAVENDALLAEIDAGWDEILSPAESSSPRVPQICASVRADLRHVFESTQRAQKSA
jgi:hypothetical protein